MSDGTRLLQPDVRGMIADESARLTASPIRHTSGDFSVAGPGMTIACLCRRRPTVLPVLERLTRLTRRYQMDTNEFGDRVMTALSPFGERSLTLVAASFQDGWRAERAASALEDGSGAMGEVAIIRPGDPAIEIKLEPDDDGICRTIIRSHLLLGICGGLAGVGIALALVLAPWPAAAASPGLTILVAALMGTFFGMLFGGLVTLRPDHAIVVDQLRDALDRGRWAVVAHPLSEAHARAALAAFRAEGGVAMRSL